MPPWRNSRTSNTTSQTDRERSRHRERVRQVILERPLPGQFLRRLDRARHHRLARENADLARIDDRDETPLLELRFERLHREAEIREQGLDLKVACVTGDDAGRRARRGLPSRAGRGRSGARPMRGSRRGPEGGPPAGRATANGSGEPRPITLHYTMTRGRRLPRAMPMDLADSAPGGFGFCMLSIYILR